MRLKKKLCILQRIILYFIPLIALSIFIFSLNFKEEEIIVEKTSDVQTIPQFDIELDLMETLTNYTVFSPGCKIQDFDPFDPLIVKNLDGLYSFHCSKRPSLVVKKGIFLMIDFKTLGEYGGQLDYCLYLPIYRDGQSDDKYKYGEIKQFSYLIIARHEFIKVECYNFYEKIYEDFFAYVKKKKYVEQRCNKIKQQKHNRRSPDINIKRLSIMIVGIDSVSRLNFLRYCPKTHNYLIEEMNAIHLKGYNKVGDNTFHNMVPFLLNSHVTEMNWNDTMSFDQYPFIWKEYAMNGYRTMLAEDFPEAGLFNNDKLGFLNSPSDYYLRPFYLALYNSSLVETAPHACAGNKMHTNIILDYTYDFANAFQNRLYFAFSFITTLTHDWLLSLQYGDEHYLAFLQNLVRDALLSNTVLFFLSDHGIRFGGYRESFVGKLEERLPMAYIVFPTWFRNKYPHIIKTLIRNSNRLTTPFDMYATLKDLLNFNGRPRKNILTTQRSISLFDNIPLNRTCEDASILPHWCTCQRKTKLSNNDNIVIKLADYIIKIINEMTDNNRDICAELSVSSILDGWLYEVNDKLLQYNSLLEDGEYENVHYTDMTRDIKDITITLVVNPSEAKFEATARYNQVNNKFILMGDISRINKYGNQSHCIHDHMLKKFCYCNDLLNIFLNDEDIHFIENL